MINSAKYKQSLRTTFMNNYEITIVLPVDAEEKDVLARVEKEMKDAGGTINKTEEWGKRELAYTIKKQGGPAGGYKEGVYHYFQVTVPGDKIGGINRFLETSEGVLRHLIVRMNGKVQMSNVKSSSKSKAKQEKPKSKKVVKKRNGNKKSK